MSSTGYPQEKQTSPFDDERRSFPAPSRRPWHRLTVILLGALALMALAVHKPTIVCRWPAQSLADRARRVLAEVPLIDGHNDLLINIRAQYGGHIYGDNFTGPFSDGTYPGDTDLSKMARGQYAGAFWSAFWPCQSGDLYDFDSAGYGPVIRGTLQQLDLFHRLAAVFPDRFPHGPSRSAAQARKAFAAGRVVGPLIIEGLHQIGNSPAVLRHYHALGVRYATLNWNCHNLYSDAALLTFVNNQSTIVAPPLHGGLSPEGRLLIREMNRIGVMVDLSHVSELTMREVLVGSHNGGAPVDGWNGSLAPPIFSHSSAWSLCNHPRNVPDDILDLVKQRNALVMVNITPNFISCKAPPKGSPPGSLPVTVKENATLEQVARHILHIGRRIGFEHVGLGTDFSGMEEWPVGLEDVSKMPKLIEELMRNGVTDKEARMVIGLNALRVWEESEKVAARLQAQGAQPLEDEGEFSF